MPLHEALVDIQSKLKAPKDQLNKFGGYNYRSCEDILEAVKPLLKEHSLSLTITDEMVAVADRVYVKATARLTSGASTIEVSAFARESAEKKGMDDAQITGSASSYARKYALNGLFCIDDTKDSDATNDHGKKAAEPARPAPAAPAKPAVPKARPTLTKVMETITACKDAKVAEAAYERAGKYEWRSEEWDKIAECFDNTIAKIKAASSAAA